MLYIQLCVVYIILLPVFNFNLWVFFRILFHYLNLETITYTEDTLASRKTSNEKEIKISDLATKVSNIYIYCLLFKYEFHTRTHHFIRKYFMLHRNFSRHYNQLMCYHMTGKWLFPIAQLNQMQTLMVYSVCLGKYLYSKK